MLDTFRSAMFTIIMLSLYTLAIFNKTCGVYSYIDDKEYKFYNPINLNANKSYDDILSFAKEMGPSWVGHRAFCDSESSDSDNSNNKNSDNKFARYTIINHLNQTKTIKIIPNKKIKKSDEIDNNYLEQYCDFSNFANGLNDLYRRTPITVDNAITAARVCLTVAGTISRLSSNKNSNFDDNSELFLGNNNAYKHYQGIIKTTESPAKCIPLISDDPKLNPYHPLLTPKDAATRKVKTFPFLLHDTAFSCPADSPKECEHFIQKKISVTEGTSYAITDGIVSLLSNTVGSTSSNGKVDSFIHEISNAIEGGNSIQKAIMNKVVNSETVIESIKKIVEMQLANTITHSTYNQNTKGSSNTNTLQTNSNSGTTNGVTKSDKSFQNIMSEKVDEVTNDKTIYEKNLKEKESGWNVNGGLEAFFKGATVKLKELLFVDSVKVDTNIGGSLSAGYKNDNKNTKTDINSNLFKDQKKNTLTNSWGQSADHQTSSTSFQSVGSVNEKQTSAFQNFMSGKSDSDSKETRKKDSISNAVENAKKREDHWSSTDTSSLSTVATDKTKKSNAQSEKSESSNSLEDLRSFINKVDISVKNYKETTISTEISHKYYVSPGKTKVLAFVVTTDSTQMHWLCRDGENNKPYFSEVNQLTNFKENYILAVLDRTNAENTFEIEENLHSNAGKNSISSKKVIIVKHSAKGYNSIIQSEKYELIISNKGNMIIHLKDDTDINPIWQTDTNIQRTTDSDEFTSPIRLFINEMGHLVLQAEDMFTKQESAPYIGKIKNPLTGVEETNTYTTIWSTVPKHLRYQVGNPNGGYILVLHDIKTTISTDVDLVLYDGGGSKIWCARGIMCKSPNANGYRFPMLYLVPTDFATPRSELDIGDPHNSINGQFTHLSDGYPSENTHCIYMPPNLGITSPNGRFKLILQETGNVIFKDGTRTMWESFTANLPFAVAPYKMMLSDTGSLYVTDSKNMLIFSTITTNTVKKTKLIISNEGELIIQDQINGHKYLSTNTVPTSDVYVSKVHSCYSKCRECMPKHPRYVNAIYLTAEAYTSNSYVLTEEMTMFSPNGIFAAKLSSRGLRLYKLDSEEFKQNKAYYWGINIESSDEVTNFTMALSPNVGIYNKYGLNVYSFPTINNLVTTALHLRNDGSLLGVTRNSITTIKTCAYQETQSSSCVIL